MENVLLALIATIVPLMTLILSRRRSAPAGGNGATTETDRQHDATLAPAG